VAPAYSRRMPSTNPAIVARLTPREAQILELTARGLHNDDIAAALGVTRHTVKFHLGGVFRKLNVANRTEAVAAWLRPSS
jgi:DNA-binding CsgD family transcriptional regulator